MIRLLMNRAQAPARTAQDRGPLAGPMTDQVVLEQQRRNDEKRRAALEVLGRDWILHPSRRVR